MLIGLLGIPDGSKGCLCCTFSTDYKKLLGCNLYYKHDFHQIKYIYLDQNLLSAINFYQSKWQQGYLASLVLCLCWFIW